MCQRKWRHKPMMLLWRPFCQTNGSVYGLCRELILDEKCVNTRTHAHTHTHTRARTHTCWLKEYCLQWMFVGWTCESVTSGVWLRAVLWVKQKSITKRSVNEWVNVYTVMDRCTHATWINAPQWRAWQQQQKEVNNIDIQATFYQQSCLLNFTSTTK